MFENTICTEEYNLLQELVQSECFKRNLDFNDGYSVINKLLKEVKNKLGITLNEVKTSYIIRMQ